MTSINIHDDFPISQKQYGEMFFNKEYTAQLADANDAPRDDHGCFVKCSHDANAQFIEVDKLPKGTAAQHAQHDGDVFIRAAHFDVSHKVPSYLPDWIQGLHYEEVFNYTVGSNVATWKVTPDCNGGLGNHVVAEGQVAFEPSPVYPGGTRRRVLGDVSIHDLPWWAQPLKPAIEAIARKKVREAYQLSTEFTNEWLAEHPLSSPPRP